MEHIKQQTATKVNDNYVEGFNIYLAKVDGARHWFKVPKSVDVAKKVKCIEIMEYYDEKGGVE